MHQRVTPWIGALALLALTGCPSGEPSSQHAENQPFHTLLVTDYSTENDNGFIQGTLQGMLDFYGESWNNQINRGRLYDVQRAKTPDEYLPLVTEATKSQYWDLIIAVGFTFADAITECATQFPGQKYAVIDVDWLNLPNVAEYAFAEEEGSYLAGVVAGLKAQEDGVEAPVFGFVGGIASALITKFEMGYIQGVESVAPHARFVDFYAESWDDIPAAARQATAWYDNGVYAIYAAAGATGLGVIETARTYRKSGKNVWAIGVDVDQYDLGLYAPGESAVLTSMLKRVAIATMDILTSVQNQTFQGGKVTILTTAQNGIGYTDTNLTALGTGIIEQANRIRADIVAKQITIIPTYRAAREAGRAPPGLAAKDE